MLYYLRHGCAPSEHLFRDAQDYEAYKNCLTAAVYHCDAQLLAYSLTAKQGYLALRVGHRTAGSVMSAIGKAYVRIVHRRRSSHGPLFLPHHRSVLVEEELLGELIRYVHWQPVLAGQARELAQWPHSSHQNYIGNSHIPRVDVESVRRSLGLSTVLDCHQFMSVKPNCAVARGIEQGLPGEPRVYGSAAFLRSLGLDVKPALHPTLESAARSVCFYFGVTEAQLLSASREVRIARSVFAWYVEQRGIASISGAARYLGCHYSSLHAAIARHKRRCPSVFDMQAIRSAGPLLPVVPPSELTTEPIAQSETATPTRPRRCARQRCE